MVCESSVSPCSMMGIAQTGSSLRDAGEPGSLVGVSRRSMVPRVTELVMPFPLTDDSSLSELSSELE